MTNDGQFAYTWDDSDRLISVRDVRSGQTLMTCSYDGLGRRRERVLGGVTNRYVYDGWLVVAVLDGANQVLETYTHGPDLSGTLAGAGGIGGILSCRSGSVSRFFHYDGNGNVVTVTDTNQAIVASLDYGPFGTLLTHSGSYQPRYRFSSKECDEPVGLYYYGFRYYSPKLGRWLSRDPIGDAAILAQISASVSATKRRALLSQSRSPLLYHFVHNDPMSRHDYLGLEDGGSGSCPPSGIDAICDHVVGGLPGDDEWTDPSGAVYDRRCLVNACSSAMRCVLGAVAGGAGNVAVCAGGCCVTLLGGPISYGVCMELCLGADAIATIIDIASCLDTYNKAKDACKKCKK